jgi:hypothetical protein
LPGSISGLILNFLRSYSFCSSARLSDYRRFGYLTIFIQLGFSVSRVTDKKSS